jgi:threonine synthase
MEESRPDPAASEVITLTPLDGAVTASIEPLLFPELEATRALASDVTRSLKERLQAYEDIIDSEVGDTALTRARNLERESRIRHLYLKFEGGNPTGTQKDRIAFAQSMDAMRRGFDALTVATCGNYGAAVAVPVSNGTTLAGSSRGQNPIVRAFRKGLSRCEDLKPEEIRETQVNEPLVNWHSTDGDIALDAIHRTSGWADDVTDKEMLSTSKTLKDAEGLSVLPASTAGLIAFLDRHKADPMPGDRYVAVVTGRRS